MASIDEALGFGEDDFDLEVESAQNDLDYDGDNSEVLTMDDIEGIEEVESDDSDDNAGDDSSVDESDNDDIDDIIDQATEDDHSEEDSAEADDSPLFMLASQWRDDFFLKEEDVKPGMTPIELEDIAFKRLKENTELRLNTYIKDRLNVLGIDPELIFDESDTFKERERLTAYRDIESLKFDDLYDEEGNIRELGMAYYINKGNSKDEAEYIVDNELRDRDSEDLFNKYQDYFVGLIAPLDNNIKTKIEAHKSAGKQIHSENADKFKRLLDSGVIGGVTYSKEDVDKIKDGFFNLNQVIVDRRGNRRRGTLYDKIKQQIDDDIEASLSIFAERIINTKESIQTKAEESARKSVLAQLSSKSKTRSNSRTRSDEKGLFRPL